MRWAHRIAAGFISVDERSGAHGQAVWSWHPGADAKFATTFAGDGGKTAGPRGERGVSRKAIAQGRPVVRLVPVVLPRAFLLHADHGCSLHPAFLCALSFEEGETSAQA